MMSLAEQAAQDGIADVLGDLPTQPGQRVADAVSQRRGGGEQDLKEVEHHGEEGDGAPQRVQQHPVDSAGALIRLRRNIIGRIEHRLPPGVDCFLAGRREDRRALPLLERRQLCPQVVDARPAVRDDRDHRDAQRRRQRLDVDSAAAGGQFVAHGQRQQAG